MLEILVKYLVMPSSIITLTAVFFVGLIGIRRARRWAIAAAALGLGLYVVCGAGPVAFALLGSLEFQVPAATAGERATAHDIVVLSGYAERDADVPLSSEVNSNSAFRLMEAAMRFRERPDSTVYVSGLDSVATIMRDVLVALGVPAAQIVVDGAATSTRESAVNLAARLGTRPFLLVTSAGHMPRSMGVFRRLGCRPLAVPTDFMTKRNIYATQYHPSPLHLHYADLATSEYAALLYYRANDWL